MVAESYDDDESPTVTARCPECGKYIEAPVWFEDGHTAHCNGLSADTGQCGIVDWEPVDGPVVPV